MRPPACYPTTAARILETLELPPNLKLAWSVKVNQGVVRHDLNDDLDPVDALPPAPVRARASECR